VTVTWEAYLITFSLYVGDNFSPPVHPPELWNYYERGKNCMPRTTNSAEGFYPSGNHNSTHSLMWLRSMLDKFLVFQLSTVWENNILVVHWIRFEGINCPLYQFCVYQMSTVSVVRCMSCLSQLSAVSNGNGASCPVDHLSMYQLSYFTCPISVSTGSLVLEPAARPST